MINVTLLPDKKLADYKFNKIEIQKLNIGDIFYHKGYIWVITENHNRYDNIFLAMGLGIGEVYRCEGSKIVEVPREIDLRIERI